MTRKHRRLVFIALALGAVFVAVGLTLAALRDNLVFFYSPTDIVEKGVEDGRRFRVGGLVEDGSVVKNGENVRFVVTDLVHTVPVAYTGILPDLFREGQGIVAEGVLAANGVFQAKSVLAKHDENYMPPEVADALKASGQWEEGKPPPGMTGNPAPPTAPAPTVNQ